MSAPQPPERCAGCGAERTSMFTNIERRGARHYANFACGSGWNSDGWHTACLAAFHLAAAHRAREQALVTAIDNMPRKDVLAEACYQGADLPKKWIMERTNFCKGYNQALKDMRAEFSRALAAAEPAPPTSHGEHEAAGGKARGGGGGDRQ